MKKISLALAALTAAVSLAAPAAAQLHEKVIYGDDGRQDVYQTTDPRLLKLADSTVALFQASGVAEKNGVASLATRTFGDEMGLCKDEPFFSQPTGAFCSGSLVAPDVVMTAGHCVTSAADCQGIKFVFGFAVKTAGAMPTSVPAAEVYGCKELIGRQQDNAGADWSLVRLDRVVAGHAPLKLNQTGVIAKGTPVLVIGHPSGLPTKIDGGAAVRDSSNPGFFVANLDTYGGNSGSAVFNAETGLVEGILVRGEQDFKYDSARQCSVSNRCPNDGCRGEDVTKIANVAGMIPAARVRERAAALSPRIASVLASLEAGRP
jgi:V8-like Glu-specific endopeptidase